MLNHGTMPASFLIGCAVAAATAAALPGAAAENDAPPEQESLRLCRAADGVDGDAREAMLERALALATEATERTPDRADAHFAVFCALGKQVEDAGIGWGSLGAVRRVRRAVDRTLELEPNHVEALIGKATMLLRLPRLLGGDREEAERLFARVRRIEHERAVATATWRNVGGTGASAAPN